jgi:starch-binding outer membrane protein, SusD/RagB family
MRAANRWYTVQSLLTALLAAGCSGVLDVHPVNDVDESQAITTPFGARAAVAGLYDALQDDSYYGGELFFFGDLSSDDVEHTGTFTTYRQIDRNDLTADNGSIEAFWDALYSAVGRANVVIQKIPGVPGLDPAERDVMLGEAHFVRALTYHNLVKFWGDTAAAGMGVPIVLIPPVDIPSTGLVTRQTTGEVYTQILSDLTDAEALLAGSSNDAHHANLMAVHALRARVFLYQKNWAGAETEALAVAAGGFALDSIYSHLFTADGADTPEDILRLSFDAVDFCWEGYYYLSDLAQGRQEISPSLDLAVAYDSSYDGLDPTTYKPTDLRGQRNITFADTTDAVTMYGAKWRTGIGAEDIHVFRFAEILLILAEARARQNNLTGADSALTPIRTRAGLPAAGLDTMSQANAIAAILNERRLELAMEGDRWPDLVRTGRVQAVMPTVPLFQALYPIPLNELDVAPGLVQNSGY